MKTIITVVVVVLILGAVHFFNGQYDQLRQFIRKCQDAGGFVTQVDSGFVHAYTSCSIASLNEPLNP